MAGFTRGGNQGRSLKRRGYRMFRSFPAGDPSPRAGVLVVYQCFEFPPALRAGVNTTTLEEAIARIFSLLFEIS